MTDSALPLAGYRILDYSQFVAGPLATMLLADLGADVVKVEAPAGDAYRSYEPLGGDESRRFYALNRNKRSVVCDLKTAHGRELSRALIASADAVVHNMPPSRALQFELDEASVRAANPRAVVAVVSAFGSDGPLAGRVGYDLIAQAYSGLLMADARMEDGVPRRSGGIPYADITAGLLACISITAGLAARSEEDRPHFEVSLLGAALATQVQNFVRIDGDPRLDNSLDPVVTAADLKQVASDIAALDVLEPYYRCYEASDGFFALACLTTAQRQRVLDVLHLTDPWVQDPQAPPTSEPEYATRSALAHRFAALFGEHPVAHWVARLGDASVPAGNIKLIRQLFDDPQVHANGLVRRVVQDRGGAVDLLGSLFKINGLPAEAPMAAPRLGQHTAELVAELPRKAHSSAPPNTPATTARAADLGGTRVI